MPYGPCKICGATNYALSMGGPYICPSCDCGIPPNKQPQTIDWYNTEERIKSLEKEVEQLKVDVQLLKDFTNLIANNDGR